MKPKELYKNLLIIIIFAGSFLFITKTLAVTNPFRPGETRDPSCAPGDPFCTVNLEKDLYKENALGVISNVTSGANSIVIGSGSTSSGDYSIAIGHEDVDMGNPGPIASGDYSVAIGNLSDASGRNSISILGSNSAGDESVAMGSLAYSGGLSSVAIGQGTYAPSYLEASFGSYPEIYTPGRATAWVNTDRLFSVGMGQNTSSRANAFTILKNGNVGISHSNPHVSLSVTGTDAIKLPSGTTLERPSDTYGGEIRFNSETDKIEYRGADSWFSLANSNAGFVLIKEEGTSLSAGDEPEVVGRSSVAIGLGTSSQAVGEISLGRFPKISTPKIPGSLDGDDILFTLGNGANSLNRKNSIIVNTNNVIGFGNVDQDALALAHQNSVFITTVTGAELDNDGQWQTPSDRNLKQNIQNLNYGLNDVLNLKPRSFDFIKTGKSSIGFVAQEIEEVVPEIVSTNSLGNKTVSYPELTAVLTNAIIELTERVESLERQNGIESPERETPTESDLPEEENVQNREDAVIDESSQEEVLQEEFSQQASIIKTSNSLNLTNILLLVLAGLLIINISLIINKKTQ